MLQAGTRDDVEPMTSSLLRNSDKQSVFLKRNVCVERWSQTMLKQIEDL